MLILMDIIQIMKSHWRLYGFVRNIIGKHIIINSWCPLTIGVRARREPPSQQIASHPKGDLGKLNVRLKGKEE